MSSASRTAGTRPVAPPLSEAHLVDPAATDAELLAEAPVCYVPERDLYLVSGFAEATAVLTDHRRFSNRFGRVMRGYERLGPRARQVLERGWPPRDVLFTVDEPKHRSHRSIVSKAFSARRVSGLESHIREIAAGLVAALPHDEPVDIVPALSVPLPMTVIADQLGVPREDLPLFKRWSDGVARELSGLITDEDEQVRLTELVVEFQHYFHALIEQRRAEPRDDVLSDLVHGRDDDGRAFDDAQVLAFLQQLLVAGNETTTSALTALVAQLAGDAELQARVRRDRDAIPTLVEEVLRLESPIQGMWRVAAEDVELAGVRIPAGALVLVRYLAANHDPARFDDPDACRLDRPKPRDHLAFGAGIHYCVGSALARLELRVACELLVDHAAWIAPAWDELPQHPPSLLLHQLPSLPVRFTEAT